jgi:hypothetical protein
MAFNLNSPPAPPVSQWTSVFKSSTQKLRDGLISMPFFPRDIWGIIAEYGSRDHLLVLAGQSGVLTSLWLLTFSLPFQPSSATSSTTTDEIAQWISIPIPVDIQKSHPQCRAAVFKPLASSASSSTLSPCVLLIGSGSQGVYLDIATGEWDLRTSVASSSKCDFYGSQIDALFSAYVSNTNGHHANGRYSGIYALTNEESSLYCDYVEMNDEFGTAKWHSKRLFINRSTTDGGLTLMNGDLYKCGGSGSGASNRCEVFDHIRSIWCGLPSMNMNRGAPVALTIDDTYVIVMGGYSETGGGSLGFATCVECWIPAKRSWQTLPW